MNAIRSGAVSRLVKIAKRWPDPKLIATEIKLSAKSSPKLENGGYVPLNL